MVSVNNISPFDEEWEIETVSYVDSSRYESESAKARAERMLQEAIDAVEKARAELQVQLKKPKGRDFGATNLWGNGTVLKFLKQFEGMSSMRYTYAALLVGSRWYLSSSHSNANRKSMDTQELIQFIGDGRCWVMTTQREIPPC